MTVDAVAPRPHRPSRSDPGTTGRAPLPSADQLVARVVGRGAPLARLRRQRPRLAGSWLWAYGCTAGDLTRITDTAAPAELFDGHGRGQSRDEAVITTIAEALERYAAGLAGAGAPIWFGSAAEAADVAVPPERFTRMSAAEHRRLGFPPYADAASIGWCEARELHGGGRALVPAQVAFIGHNLWGMEDLVQVASSKGLGTHWSDADAILHGLCELVEADAFMITYLNRLPVPEIDLGTLPARSPVRWLVDAVGTGSIGFVRAWDITTDCRVPTVLGALGGWLHGGSVVTFGLATAADPVTATTKALQEAVHTTVWMDRRSVARARAWTPSEIRAAKGRGHQKLLGANAAYLRDLEWLFAPRELVGVDDLVRLPEESPSERLATVVDRVGTAGMSCYAADLTPPDLADIGLHVWRAVVPEAQPFSLGALRYLDGRRLREVPVRLGHRHRPLAEAAFNDLPHPCP